MLSAKALKNVPNVLIAQKVVALAATFLLYAAVDNAYTLLLWNIALGLGHYVIGAVYKVASPRFKPINFVWLLLFGVVFAALFYRPNNLLYLIDPLLFATTVYTIFHITTDDQFTANFFVPSYNKIQVFYTWAIILTLIGQQIYWQFGNSLSLAFVLGGGVFALASLAMVVKKGEWNAKNIYMLLVLVGLFGLYLSGITPVYAPVLIVAFMGVYHYLLFYMHYYTKIRSLKQSPNSLNKLGPYLGLVGLVNFVFIALFYAWSLTQDQLLGYLFGYNLFIVLTWMHFVSSTRTSELRVFAGMPAKTR